MNRLYFDTNFFLYLSDKSSPFRQRCTKFIKYCKEEKILISTSAETIQEIIHYTKNIKQSEQGLKAAKKTLNLLDEFIAIDKSIINTYLKCASVYKNAGSRDLIHLAVCIENKIDKIVTFDQDFAKFKEIKIFDLLWSCLTVKVLLFSLKKMN